MVTTGTRHPILGQWKVGFNDEGILEALEIKAYLNAGFSLDMSDAVIQKTIVSVDNCYRYVPMIGYLNKKDKFTLYREFE